MTFPIPLPADNAAAYTYTGPIRDAIGAANGHQTMLAAGAPPACIVISADMPASYRAAAAALGGSVFVCDGTNDQVEINSAIDRAAALASRNDTSPAGAQQWGLVQLTGGRFNCSAAVLARTAVRLTGAGWLTELRAVNCNSLGLIMLASVNEHLVQVDNLWLNGDFANGGTCSGIDFVMTGSTNAGVAKYPNADPDCYHKISDLYIYGFATTANRNGIRLWCDATAAQRGWIIDRIQMRHISGHGMHIKSSSDGYISNTHLGTVTGKGYFLESANIKMANNKAFYCDDWALDWQSEQGACTGFEAQDSAKGVHAAARQSTMAGIVIDTCSTEGLLVNASRQAITGLAVSKAALRYGTMALGVRFLASDGCMVLGSVASTSITARTSGTPGTGAFVRLTGDTLYSAG